MTPASLGVSVDVTGSVEDLKKARPLLPVFSLFGKHDVPARISIDSVKLETAIPGFSAAFAKEPLGKRVAFDGAHFVVAEPQKGYRLDAVGLQQELAAALRRGDKTVDVPVTTTDAPPATIDLAAEQRRLEKLLATKVTFTYEGKNIVPTAKDIGGWFAPENSTMVAAPERISSYVRGAAASLGSFANIDDAATATTYAMTKGQATTFRLVSDKVAVKHYYCVAQRGLDDSVLRELKLKLAATLGDPRGWNANGQVAFIYDEQNCEMHFWLSAASAMPSFGEICDPYYSCQVYPNVVINYDRWTGATDPWNAQRLTLEDYRVMVINHEGGHWLGFGHSNCPGAGQPAPVMQQQSVDLQGCVFNPWPTQTELNTLVATGPLNRRYDSLVATACCSCGHCTGASSSAQHLI